MKECFILRAVPGAGKTKVGISIAGENGIICEADEFMMEDGEYKFDVSKLEMAHSKCYNKFQKAIYNCASKVIVSNTNTTEKEFGKYKALAEKSGYIVYSLVVENRHGNSSVHNVPEETCKAMAGRIENSLRLM